ncbi:hemagglutinin repeat-containing protein [Roseateles sp. UC29_93]|uniref:hemagglutinin repeat-containing protein n=1 Tax=Roseateles sp. UC29_93 TaxID=3350177 RepID=UPI003671B231
MNIVAGRDITLAAAQAVSDNGTKLIADRDITIDGVTNSVDTEQFKKTVKSGLFSGGGIGVTIGKQELSQATKSTQETNQGSMVGSVNGDVDILAGGKYRQIGSEVQAPGGNVTIQAKSIEIEEARNKSAQDSETKFKQAGVTLALSAPGISTAMDATKAAEHVTQTQDDRMKALAAATAISKAMQAVDEIKKLGEAMNEANQNAGIRLSLTVGSSQSKSTQHNESDQAVSSAISAGKNLSLIASGGGADSNVTVRGSALTGQDVLIKADNAINLLAAGNSSEQHSKDSSTSASVGIGVTLGKQNSLGFTASASVSKGNSDGTDNYFTTTQVTGGSSVKLVSGGDTTLQGAVVSGPKVGVDVGGNLKIESLQDTAKFDSKSMSAGGSVTIGYGSSASGNFSQSKVTADFAAVGEQAGIRAGDGGFQVNVKGNTDLKGGAITSSQASIDAGNNSLSTGTLTTSDIENRSQFKASAVMVSAGTGGGMAGAFKDSDDDRSTTRSTISAGSTTITSGDAASQAALDKLDRGATNDATAGKLAQGWNGQDLAQQAKLNAQIVAEFGAQASKEVGTFAGDKAADLRKQAKDAENAGDAKAAEALNTEAKKWDEGGAYRVAMHSVVGALTGDLGGALGAAGSAAAADQLDKLQSSMEKALTEAGFGPDKKGNNDWASALSKLASGALATGIGAAAGGGFDGASAGLNEDYNNRQLHETESKRLAVLKTGKTPEQQARLDAAACALTRCADGVPNSDPNKQYLVQLQAEGDRYSAEKADLTQGGMFEYTRPDGWRDAITRNGELSRRVGGFTNATLGAGAMVGGGLLASGGVLTCAGTVITCVAIPAGGYIAYAGSEQASDGTHKLFGTYTSTEGARVLAAFNPASYPGERDPLAEIGIDAAKLGTIALVGKYLPKSLWAAEEGLASKGIKIGGPSEQATLSAQAKLTYGDGFTTQGVKVSADVANSAQFRAVVEEYKAAGNTTERAIGYAENVVKSGAELPVSRIVAPGEELIKIVPKKAIGDDGVGPYSPYFMTKSEYEKLSKLPPEQIVQKLGLPAEQAIRGTQLGFEVYSMTPKTGATPQVFVSTIAPIEQGAYKGVGGGEQTLVANRSQWNEPVKIGTLKGK